MISRWLLALWYFSFALLGFISLLSISDLFRLYCSILAIALLHSQWQVFIAYRRLMLRITIRTYYVSLYVLAEIHLILFRFTSAEFHITFYIICKFFSHLSGLYCLIISVSCLWLCGIGRMTVADYSSEILSIAALHTFSHTFSTKLRAQLFYALILRAHFPDLSKYISTSRFDFIQRRLAAESISVFRYIPTYESSARPTPFLWRFSHLFSLRDLLISSSFAAFS